MCGIAGYYLHEPEARPGTRQQMEQFTNELLKEIQSRGRHATGIASVLPSGQTKIEKLDKEAVEFIKGRKKLPRVPQAVLLHTRHATKGSPDKNENNHPIRYGSCIITHNGHIGNDDELFESEGLKRKAEVDSSIIAALFDKYGIDKAHLALQKLRGGFAVAVVDVRKPGTLLLAKGPSSPLITLNTEHGIVWASTRWALKEAFSKTFGWAPADSMLTEWKDPGTILLVENGKVEKLEFQVCPPLEKPPATRVTSKWDDDGDDGYTSVYYNSADDKYNKFCGKCKCRKLWHEGANASGKCLARDCKCESFVSVIGPNTAKSSSKKADDKDERTTTIRIGTQDVTFRKCDGCEVSHQQINMTQLYGSYWCCKSCLGEEAALKDAEEEADARVNVAASCSVGGNSSYDELEAAHDLAIDAVAEKHGVKPVQVDWVLFKAPDDVIEREQTLISQRLMYEDDYSEFLAMILERAENETAA